MFLTLIFEIWLYWKMLTFVKEFTKKTKSCHRIFFLQISRIGVSRKFTDRLNGRSHYFAILYNTPFLLRFSMGFCCARLRTLAWIQTAAKSFDPVSGWDSFREVRDNTRLLLVFLQGLLIYRIRILLGRNRTGTRFQKWRGWCLIFSKMIWQEVFVPIRCFKCTPMWRFCRMCVNFHPLKV